jgi:tetratricopeptide (TPR) repeat protein
MDAAENELRRILEIDDQHVPSLIRLATIYTNGYGNNPKPIWQRILALEPTNEDARMGLALYYAERASMRRSGFGDMWPRGQKAQSAEEILQEGLQEVPEHPILLIELGKLYHRAGQFEASRLHLVRATEVAPRNVMILNVALHELLHAKAEEDVRTIAAKIRQIPGLRPSFWIEQGEQALGCEFGEEWARFFWDIAVEVAGPLRGEDSQAAILATIFSQAIDEEEAALADHYAKLITAHHPQSGAPEYVQALRLVEKDPAKKAPIRALLRKAKANAQKAKEPAIIELATTLEQELEFSGMSALFGRGNPFAELFGNLDELDIDEEDLFDAFRSRFR